MSESTIFKAEGVLLKGQAGPSFQLELKAGQGGLVVVRDMDLLRGLMKCCLGLEKPANGHLYWWGGREPGSDHSWEFFDFFRHIGYVDRQSQLLGALKLRDHFWLFSRYTRQEEALEESEKLVRLFGLVPYLDFMSEDLPEPQRRLALYALAFCRRPPFILMERPLQFLDRDFNLVWRLVLSRASEFGMAYLVFDRSENPYSSERFDHIVRIVETRPPRVPKSGGAGLEPGVLKV